MHGQTDAGSPGPRPRDAGGGTVTAYEYRVDGGAWTTTTSLTYDQAVTRRAMSREVEVRAVSDAAHSRGPASSIGPPSQRAPEPQPHAGRRSGSRRRGTAPEDDGGPAVSGYAVQWHDGVPGSGPITGVTVTNLTAEITGLTNGQAYQVRAAARNPLGVGTFTDPSGGGNARIP